MLDIIKGPTTLTHVLFWTAVFIVSADFCATLATVIYQRFWYRRVLRPKFSSGYTPRAAVIVPCKGTNPHLKANLENFFSLDYPQYEVIFVTESDGDPAAQVIREVIAGRPNALFCSAGLSKSCGQKNHNLLAGIARAGDADVFVFADSDVRPAQTWLRELVLPLANNRIVVTSGFRWLCAKKGSVAEWTHAYANIFIYVLFSCAFFIGGVGLWGGSMAIRRKDFEKLGVAQKWSTAVVDDLSLSQIVHKKRLRGVIVPSCISQTDELFPSVKQSVAWFERQIMFLKVYFKHIWFFLGVPLAIVGIALVLTLPAALIAAFFLRGGTFFSGGGGAAVVFYSGELCTVLLYPLLGIMPKFHRFLLCQPIVRATHVVSYLGTYTTNTITWAGVRYRLRFFGDVKSIERGG